MAIDARTPVPTAAGWLPACLVEKGQTVYTQTGKPVKVTAIQEYTPQACYKLWFADGLTLTVDARTGIPGYTRKQRQSMSRWTRKEPMRSKPVGAYSPEWILDYEESFVALNCRPLRFPERRLPVGPYEFGKWIVIPNRNRAMRQTEITRELIERFPTIPSQIPEEYMMGSFEQRLQLLRGILSNRPRCQRADGSFGIRIMNIKLQRQVQGLIESLGIITKLQCRMVVFRTTYRLIENQIPCKSMMTGEGRKVEKITKAEPRPCIYFKTDDPDNVLVVSEGFLPIAL